MCGDYDSPPDGDMGVCDLVSGHRHRHHRHFLDWNAANCELRSLRTAIAIELRTAIAANCDTSNTIDLLRTATPPTSSACCTAQTQRRGRRGRWRRRFVPAAAECDTTNIIDLP